MFFLEINFTCSVFYKDGYEGSADFVLKYDGIGQAGFLNHIIAEGIARHQRKQKKFMVRGNSIAGYGIYARQEIKKGELVFAGEERHSVWLPVALLSKPGTRMKKKSSVAMHIR